MKLITFMVFRLKWLRSVCFFSPYPEGFCLKNNTRQGLHGTALSQLLTKSEIFNNKNSWIDTFLQSIPSHGSIVTAFLLPHKANEKSTDLRSQFNPSNAELSTKIFTFDYIIGRRVNRPWRCDWTLV